MQNRLLPAVLSGFFAFSLSSGEALAENKSHFETVQSMIEFCELALEDDTPSIRAALCVGTAGGVFSVMNTNCELTRQGYDVPEFLTAEGMPTRLAGAQAFVNYARDNPDIWGMSFYLGMIEAISDSFPCSR